MFCLIRQGLPLLRSIHRFGLILHMPLSVINDPNKPASVPCAAMKKSPTQASRMKWLMGKWGRWPLELWDLRYEFTPKKNGINVHVVDTNDGEVAQVSKTQWDGRTLNFDLYWRSNKYRTTNRIRPLTKTKAIHTYTHWETWLKLGPWLLGKDAAKEFWGDPRKKSEWIFGDWFDPEGWRNNVRVARNAKRKLSVDAGNAVKISKVRWNGKILRFVVYTPEYKSYDIHALRPLSHTKAEHEITEDCTLLRCDE